MFLLDTNVVSELMRLAPEPNVEAWVAGQPSTSLFFSAVSEAEIRFGAAILPEGRRRKMLISNIEGMLHEAFGDRVLSFDQAAARAYGDLAAMRRSAGRNVEPIDCQIAAIAHSQGLAVATRNTSHFEVMEIELINPWAA